jgi:glycine/D-amino acid oxidase-like deaminating enzyme
MAEVAQVMSSGGNVGTGAQANGKAESVWASHAVAAPVLPRLAKAIQADIVILGAGYTGLNAAWEFAQKGVDCVVLEAGDAGWGASGRNGGMAVLRYKKSWSALATAYGNERAQGLYGLVHEAVDILEQNVSELCIDCSFSRSGHLTAATSANAANALTDDIAWLSRAVGDDVPTFVSKEEMLEFTGSAIYSGGYFDPRSAGIHPLNYSRGFAAALIARGVEIYGQSPATAISVDPTGGRVHVETPSGRVSAKKVLICTSGYTDEFNLGNDLHRRVLPITVAVITTDPLPSGLAQPVLPQGHLVTDTRNLVNYYRRAPNGGLLFGGRGSFSGKDSPKYFDLLRSQMAETFPQLKGIGVQFTWTGRIAVTLDHFPHIGALGDSVFFALGYGGRGVALSNLLGKHLARMALGEKTSMSVMAENSFAPVPFRSLHLPAKHVAALYYRMRDKLGV